MPNHQCAPFILAACSLLLLLTVDNGLAQWTAKPDVAPPAPVGCVATITSIVTNNTPAAISTGGPSTVTRSVVVSSSDTFLYDIDVEIDLDHTACGDLQVALTSPAGTTVTLTSNNGGTFNNLFSATTWDDDADVDGTVPFGNNASSTTDSNYSDNVTGFPLTPEEPLAAFVGENPNGTWTLTVSDLVAGNGGTLNSWALRRVSLQTPPIPTALPVASNNTRQTISSATSPVISTITIPQGGTILKVKATTNITYPANGNLQMNLISPAGTLITLTSNNGNGFANVFTNTTWDDDADPDGVPPFNNNNNSVTDASYAPGVSGIPLAPEEALGAFIGENPAGVWTLRIANQPATADTGTFDGWSLEITTASCNMSVVSASSFRVHNGQPFEIPLPLTAPFGVESRGPFGSHNLRFTLDSAPVKGSAMVTAGSAFAVATELTGNVFSVFLNSVADQQLVTVRLFDVEDSLGRALPETFLSLNFLAGDVNGNKTVNATDVAQTKSNSGAAVGAANFRSDVNANGAINASDVGLVKSKSGNTVP